jgi:hypothetical protein
MDRITPYEVSYRVQHRHKDGTWADMEEVQGHDAADHDPERKWGLGRLFRCQSCPEEVTMVPSVPGRADER